ncbi:hypothetical protein EK21DRAFT_94957 [Setomelanomma holmii]|uniref:Apple domain-containing protein n=1 Tax=Setomelanomma holmii TaxID=210430 RepID=A0A9P4GWW9_9PLEO|nr:hypothetical protein EK21DRAFT_94957 [Setomelanomma holmii]
MLVAGSPLAVALVWGQDGVTVAANTLIVHLRVPNATRILVSKILAHQPPLQHLSYLHRRPAPLPAQLTKEPLIRAAMVPTTTNRPIRPQELTRARYTSADACIDACNTTPQCVAIVYFYARGSCSLLSAVSADALTMNSATNMCIRCDAGAGAGASSSGSTQSLSATTLSSDDVPLRTSTGSSFSTVPTGTSAAASSSTSELSASQSASRRPRLLETPSAYSVSVISFSTTDVSASFSSTSSPTPSTCPNNSDPTCTPFTGLFQGTCPSNNGNCQSGYKVRCNVIASSPVTIIKPLFREDFAAHDPQAATADACIAACDVQPACVAVLYRPASGAKQCQLYSSVGGSWTTSTGFNVYERICGRGASNMPTPSSTPRTPPSVMNVSSSFASSSSAPLSSSIPTLTLVSQSAGSSDPPSSTPTTSSTSGTSSSITGVLSFSSISSSSSTSSIFSPTPSTLQGRVSF